MWGRIKRLLLLVLLLTSSVILLTKQQMQMSPASFASLLAMADKVQVLDRHHEPLSVTYQNRWNVHDVVALHDIPALLIQAFIQAEDKRFYRHRGQDWQARLHALYQNLLSLSVVRGASTISEQVVRMLHPRPRTFWSRWLEGWEAQRLEQQFSKQAILEFYLNQVPYAANRRGVRQAARYYFDRDLDTLNSKEMLALVVLVRAPSRLDIYHNEKALQSSLKHLAEDLAAADLLSRQEFDWIAKQAFVLSKPGLTIDASHFVGHVLKQDWSKQKQLLTTLDGNLQGRLQGLLDNRLRMLQLRQVENAALLVADHQTGEILAWVVGGSGDKDKPAAKIDAVTALRQPGSVLKPFLYALALEQGWSASAMINDSPLSESVGYGIHQYQNYSRVFYGSVSLREALGNSLNIPALRILQTLGIEGYLALLRDLGFIGINRHPNVYGDGLALGNAEVSLYELVQAYAVLANRGQYKALRVFRNNHQRDLERRIFSPEASSLIANILSDPNARRLEFGSGSVLNLPRQTAVKTGTSSDFRDSWTLGFNERYVVGVWMGNLDNKETDGITGSTGPALVLRSVFSLLNRHRETRPLFLSPRLINRQICSTSGELSAATSTCTSRRREYFLPEHPPQIRRVQRKPMNVRLRQPTPGLHLAVDPRIPLAKQAFEFVITGLRGSDRVAWRVDEKLLHHANRSRYLWPLQRGEHAVQATVYRDGRVLRQISPVGFSVK